ncbi:MAG: class I SAM-dependent methyltransferase [bacterium]
MDAIKKALKNPRFAILYFPVAVLNGLLRGGKISASDFEALNEVQDFAKNVKGAIGDHLTALFIESLVVKPKLIVELGVRQGDSTFALGRAAKLCQARLVSVDVEDFEGKLTYENWTFVKRDDIKFAGEFRIWCKKRKIKPQIDVLFIDTSHYYRHTTDEIKVWFPFLSPKARVFFHDTNLRIIYPKKSGGFGVGWDNKRGVIRALEDYFEKSFNEKIDFTDVAKGWVIRHSHYSGGFTILETAKFP